jgi:DNA-binding IclR family transcriptional regulator
VKASAAPAGRRGLNSVTNAFSVLEYLVEAGEAGVSEIARRVGVTVGTAHRLVGTLVEIGWAEQNSDNRKYRPSQRLVAMAHRMRKTLNARELAHEQLTSLVQVVHETGNLAIMSDQQVLYVDKVTSDQPFGLEARIGSRLPAFCTALGKVLVASLDDAALDDYLALLQTLRRGKHRPTPPPVAAFRRELRLTRDRGYALDAGEYLPDVYCAAAPVRASGGRVVAAMSVSAPRSRFEANSDNLVREVCRAAATLSDTLQDLGLGNQAMDFAVLGAT